MREATESPRPVHGVPSKPSSTVQTHACARSHGRNRYFIAALCATVRFCSLHVDEEHSHASEHPAVRLRPRVNSCTTSLAPHAPARGSAAAACRSCSHGWSTGTAGTPRHRRRHTARGPPCRRRRASTASSRTGCSRRAAARPAPAVRSQLPAGTQAWSERGRLNAGDERRACNKRPSMTTGSLAEPGSRESDQATTSLSASMGRATAHVISVTGHESRAHDSLLREVC